MLLRQDVQELFGLMFKFASELPRELFAKDQFRPFMPLYDGNVEAVIPPREGGNLYSFPHAGHVLEQR